MLALDRSSVTLATLVGGGGAGATTVMVAMPSRPPTVARIETMPTETAVTSPDDDTLATCVFELAQVTP